MNTTTTAHANTVIPADAPAAARTTLRLMRQLRVGTLAVQMPDGSMQHFGSGEAPHAAIRLNNWNLCVAALKSGDIGVGETYIAGDWTTPNLAAMLRLFLVNRHVLEDVIFGSWWGRLAYRLRHFFNRNTRTNSKKNIQVHYDLGNSFYELWLDGTMNYSSALFEGRFEQPLADAQHAKVRRALHRVEARPGARILEIGCGWGALAEKAASEFGAHTTGVTLSREQLAFAQQRMARAGHAALADLRLQDYRDIQDEGFDAVCSIEMIEAVGREYWPTYFASVARALRSGGKACIQAIVIKDELFEGYIDSTDFIQQYVFPGGCLLCPSEFRQAAQAAGLEVVDEFGFGLDYAETLRRWRETFLAERARVQQIGFDERFARIWEFYLAYCEAGFSERDLDVVQYTLRKP